MTAGFMLVTMEDVVSASIFKFFLVHEGFSCLERFQSMLTKIMFATAVLCSSGSVSCFVAADDLKADHADDIADHADDHADDMRTIVKRRLRHGSSKCLSLSLHECWLQ